MALVNDTVRYKLKYVGGSNESTVLYIHIKDGTNDLTFYNESITDIESRVFEAGADTLNVIIESVLLFMPVFISQLSINSVEGHLSTYKKTYVNWVEGSPDNFSFGKYFGESPVFNVRLGGMFHVLEGDYHTLNGIYKDMVNIRSWDKLIFRDYKNGRDGTGKNIIGLKETFMNNDALLEIVPGTLQYLPYVESIRRCWANDVNISELRDGTFTMNAYLRDAYEAFLNTRITVIPPRLITIG